MFIGSHQLQHFFRFWFGNCVRPDDGSLIRAKTCWVHWCKFLLINSCVGRLFGSYFYSVLLYTAGWKASNYFQTCCNLSLPNSWVKSFSQQVRYFKSPGTMEWVAEKVWSNSISTEHVQHSACWTMHHAPLNSAILS
jgi:hypothetical protein